MTDREKHIAKKKKEIEKIFRQQAKLIKKVVAIPVKPSKRKDVNLRRMGKTLAIAMQVRALEMQKQMIIAQPIPKYPPGSATPGGIAIVGETGPEPIITSNGTIAFNQHPCPHFEPSTTIHPVPGIDKEPDV